MLFTEGITKPLKGWVKYFRPPTLQDSIKKNLDMVDTMVRKDPINTFIPQKGRRKSFTNRHGLRKIGWTKKLRERLEE
jgi:hypothetical protein